MKKRVVILGLVFAMAGSMLAGCGSSAETDTVQKSEVSAGAAESETPETRVVVNGNGEEITIPYEVERVAPSIGAFAQVTEMLLNGNGKIVAAATQQISDDFKQVFTDYTESNANNYDASSVEDLIAAGTQVVYGPASAYSEEQLAQLEQAGIVFVDVSNLSDSASIMESFRLIGEILGEDEAKRAEEFCDYYQANLDDCAKRTESLSDEDKVSVLRLGLVGGGYTTINKTDIFNSIINEAGGINISADYEASQGGASGGPQSGLPVDAEQIVTWNPDVIITLNQDTANAILSDPSLADVQAIKDGKVYNSPQGLYLWGVRSGENAMMAPWLGTKLYPDLYADVDMEQIVIDFYADWYHTELDSEQAAAVLAGK